MERFGPGASSRRRRWWSWWRKRRGRERGLAGVAADAVRDLRQTLRSLARKPLFSGVTIAVLALGIGATTSVFTLLDAVVLSGLPFPEPGRLVSVSHRGVAAGQEDMGQTAAWHFTYEDENKVFEALGMYGPGWATVTGRGPPEAVPVLFVTSGLFRALRVTPVLGRALTPADDQPSAPHVAVLSYRYWRSRFGGDPRVVGQTIEVSDIFVGAREIVGVMGPELRSLGPDPALFVPAQFDRSTLFVGNTGWGALARLKHGVTLRQAENDMARMLPMAFQKFPGGPVVHMMRNARVRPALQPLRDRIVGSGGDILWILMGGASVLLLIACANVANLVLARATERSGEMAVRRALGASARRMGWEHLREGLLISGTGGALGVALAVAGLRALVLIGPATLPRLDEASLDLRVLTFALMVSAGTSLVFGVAPMLRRPPAVRALLSVGGHAERSGRRSWVQDTLAAGQIAFVLVLLVGSGLLVRTFVALRGQDPGFHGASELLAFRLTLPTREYPDPDVVASTHERIMRRISEIPGVEGVALANNIPMAGGMNVNPLYLGGELASDEPVANPRHKWVGAGYFRALGIPLAAGRAFAWQDIHDRTATAMVSESLARRYWGSPEAALGRKVAARPDPPRWHEIIGVARDVREDGMGEEPPDEVYWPQVTLAFWQGGAADRPNSWRSMGYAVRSGRVGEPGFLDAVRSAVWTVDPDLPLRNVGSLSDFEARSTSRTTFTLRLLTLASAIALVLALVGVYGMIAYTTSLRRRELGLRVALGAERARIRAIVLGRGALVASAGIALGAALALSVTHLMRSTLFDVSPTDPATFLIVSGSLFLAALLAAYVPAERASRVDPMTVLKAD